MRWTAGALARAQGQDRTAAVIIVGINYGLIAL
jgi:hypothetical protein